MTLICSNFYVTKVMVMIRDLENDTLLLELSNKINYQKVLYEAYAVGIKKVMIVPIKKSQNNIVTLSKIYHICNNLNIRMIPQQITYQKDGEFFKEPMVCISDEEGRIHSLWKLETFNDYKNSQVTKLKSKGQFIKTFEKYINRRKGKR